MANRHLYNCCPLWAPPTPGLWNKVGMAGIKCLLSFPFLQVTGDPVPVQDDQLVQHLVPVAVPLCPFLYDVPTGQVQHFLKCRVTREHTFSFRHLPILAVQPLYNIGCIHYPAYVIRKLEKGAYIFPVVLPITDRIRVFPSPFFLHGFQFRESCGFIWAIIYCFEIGGKFFQVTVIDILERVPQHMDDASLDLRLRVDRLYGFFKATEPVYEKNSTSFTPRFFRSLSMPSQNLLVSFAPTVMLRISLYLSMETPRTT